MKKIKWLAAAAAVSVGLGSFAANPGISFRSAGKGPQQLGAGEAFASFEALVPIGAADAVTMTVRGADGSVFL